MEKAENTPDLRFAVRMLFVAFFIEFLGFFFSDSLALLSDSLFVFTEFLFFLVLFYRLGSKRIMMVSVIFSLMVFAAGLLVMYFAVSRFVFGGETRGFETLIFASVGFAMGAFVMRKVRFRFVMGVRESFFHVFRKSVSSLLVMAGGVWIVFTGEMFVDCLLAFLIALIVMLESIVLFRDSALLMIGVKKSKTYLFKTLP